MENRHLEMRAVIKFLTKEGRPPMEIHDRLMKVRSWISIGGLPSLVKNLMTARISKWRFSIITEIVDKEFCITELKKQATFYDNHKSPQGK